MTQVKLSPTQQKALALAATNPEGALYRLPGGFWCARPFANRPWTREDPWVSKGTVEALVRLGLMRWVMHPRYTFHTHAVRV